MSDKPPVLDFATDWDHTDPQWVNNPYPIWEDLRSRCPVAHTERYGGGWFPATHAGVTAIAKDTDHFTSRSVVVGNGRPGEEDLPAPIGLAPPITSDPPFHAIARRLILPAFAPGAVNALEPQIRALCVELLDRFGEADVINAGLGYANYIPPSVIRQMLGFPEADTEKFLEIVHVVLENVDKPEEERLEEFLPINEYFLAQIEDHVANPRDDLTSYLLNVELEGEKLSHELIGGVMILILVAGIDTTWSAIGASLWHLAQHPEDLARLVNEPDLMPVAIEEFLRFYAPVTMARLVKEDMEYLGCPMKQDDWILLGFPAANRDPVVFKDADKFIIDRAENRHVAFGLGIHRCAGSNLARLEMRVAIEEFIKRYPRFELADPAQVTWAQGQVRGPRSLTLRVR
ncbi:MAG: cytochrome P450 [Acidobacteriota bacterium]|nr:cytochrome P450 [Acidobacteriota bacterium]MDE3044260.1 cytochrome P450 [Acidobacteriota bacterium]MDE3106603.1 cytochrome P450 [Acidobacteriota bacterium]